MTEDLKSVVEDMFNHGTTITIKMQVVFDKYISNNLHPSKGTELLAALPSPYCWKYLGANHDCSFIEFKVVKDE